MQDMYMGNPLGSQLPITDGEPNEKTVWSSLETHKRINDIVVAENLLPYPYDINDGDIFGGVTATINADGSITLNGTATAEMGIRLLNIKQNRVWKAGTYTLSRGASNASVSLYDADGKRVAWTKTTLTFTLTEDTIADFRINTVKGATYDNVTIYPMVEVGSVAHAYQPSYLSRQNLSNNKADELELTELKMLGWTVPKECPIQNSIKGKQFVQKVGRVDLGSATWSKGATNAADKYRMGSSNIASIVKRPLDDNSKANVFCLSYEVMSNNATYARIQGIGVSAVTGNVFVYDSNYETADAGTFKSAMHGIYLYYELATPITKQIDGNEAIQSIKNTIGTVTNMLKPTLETTTLSGVTCTNNGDGTYTFNGTANGNTFFKISCPMHFDKDGTYRLVGCPSEGSSASYFMYIEKASTILGMPIDELGKGKTFSPILSGDAEAYVKIADGYTCDNLVFKPMLTTNLNATYNDFVPYTGSTGKLNSDVAEIIANLIYKKADDYANAYANAISEIVIVGKATLSGNTIALSLCIPKLAITDTWTYWMNSATYNNNTRFVQASIKNAAINNLFFFEGNTLINDAVFEFYYK